MSDPKDKLVLFKEILSLMIVTIGFMTALMSSGIFKNVNVGPVALTIIIAVILFLVQFLVRMVFGEEKYNEIKKKVLYTARDFSIILLVIAGFYFAGKYAANQSAPLNGPAHQPAAKGADDEKTLSAVPLKNLKKEKIAPPVKQKEKQAAKKSDIKPARTESKAAAKEVDKAEKPAAAVKKITDEAKVETSLETSLISQVKPEITAEALLISEMAPAAAENKPEKIKKTAEIVVINVTAEEEPDNNEVPLEPISTSVMESPAIGENDEKLSAPQSGGALSYKLKKDEKEEDEPQDDAKTAEKSKTSVNFEQTPPDLKDKVNNDKVIIKKEYELGKTPGGIKNAGDKVIDGGRKLIDGGADLIEKAGQGIKKQINKVIK